MTDMVHYRCIRSAADCAVPFAGKRETGAYFEWNQDDPVFYVDEDFARVEEIGAKLTYASDTDTEAVFSILGDYTKVIGCVTYDSMNAGTMSVNGFSLAGDRAMAANCIAHDIEGHGFKLASTGFIWCVAHNCTAVDNGGYGYKTSTGSYNVLTNCVGSNNTGGDFSSDNDFYDEYNMSSDDTAFGEHSTTNKDFTNMWVSETSGSEDYHLSETGVVDSDFQGGAYPDSGVHPLDYTLADDIDGQTRFIWYRGADESGPPGHIYDVSVISGSVGPLDGVPLSGLPGDPVTIWGGSYSAIVSNGWSGTVTPAKVGYAFDPTSRVYSDVNSDQTNQDYTPTWTTYTISGSVGTLDGVTMDGLPVDFRDRWMGSVQTSGGGFYSSTVGHGWSGTVTPTKAGYTFVPVNRVYSNVTSDRENEDYTPTIIHEIEGNVGSLDGVTMSGLPGDPVTANGGRYSADVEDGWLGTVTPTKVGYTFNPVNRVYSNVTSDQMNQDFAPVINTYTVSGSVGSLDGVTMNGLPGNPVTSGGGSYSADVDYGWSGTVTPTKAGYTFVPVNRVYSNVTSDQENQDYTPTVDSFTIISESFEGAGYEEAFTEDIGTSCFLDEDSSIPGAPPIDFGSQCLKSVSNATGYKARADLVYGTQQPKTFTTFYVYIQSENLAADGSNKNIAALLDSSVSAGFVLRLYKSGAGNLKFKFRLYNNGSSTAVYTSSALSLNTWYKIGIKYDDTNNTYEFRLDDSTVSGGSLIGAHATGIKQWRLGFWQNTQAETGTIYLDELTVSTESFN
jgi:hypothetical protein